MPPKTRKKSSAPRGNTKGKQVARADAGTGKLMNLPVDVFLEIAAHCHPSDLLRLSRVSSELRSFVLAKRNKGIWVSARNGLDPPMPACPEDLSEPQYASLVFERLCTVCGAECTLRSKVSYAVRVRLCTPCWKANVKVGYAVTSELKVRRDRSLMRVIFNLLPEATDNLWQYMAMRRKLGVLNQVSHQDFYQPELTATVKEYYAIVEESGEESKALEEFVERRKARTLERVNFHWAVVQWEYNHRRAKEEAQRQAVEKRRAAVEKRLQDLGYERADYTGVHEFHMLTLEGASWDEIEPKLLPVIASRRAAREAAAFRDKYWARSSQLKTHYLAFLARDRSHPQNAWKRHLPGFVEAARLPFLHALVTATEPDVDLPEEEFARLEERVREAGEAYCARVRADLARTFRRDRKLEMMREGVVVHAADPGMDDAVPDDVLLDAHGTLFRCTSFPCNNFSHRAMTASSLIEHWQKLHPFEWNGGERVWLAAKEKRELVPVLLEVLELPANTALSVLEDAVASQTESVMCACGGSIDPATNRYEALDRMICHLLPTEGASTSETVKHRITLAPSPGATV